MVRIFRLYVSIKSITLIAVESVLIALSLLAAVRLRFWRTPAEFDFYFAVPSFGVQCVVVVLVFQVCLYYNGLYDLSDFRGRSDQMIRLCQSLGAACVILGSVYFAFPELLLGRGIFVVCVFMSSAFMLLARMGVDAVWRLSDRSQRALIVGGGHVASLVVREFQRRSDLNVDIVAILDGEQPTGAHLLAGIPIWHGFTNLYEIAQEQQVNRIIIACDDRVAVDGQSTSFPNRDLIRLRVMGVRIEDAQATLTALTGRVPLDVIRPSWFLFSDGFHRSATILACKRLFDVVLSFTGVVITSPLMVLVAIAVRLDSPGPVLYRQVRAGLRGEAFEVLKFRSMRVDAESKTGAQWATLDDPRVTRLGRFLRKYRLDELPQFFNVLRGEMSFVGPRPERPEFIKTLRHKIPYYDERLSVRPGLTGWAQVEYPYGASLDDAARKLEYDLFYLQNMSVLFDCLIVFNTVRTVLFGVGGR